MMERASWTYMAILGISMLYPLAQSFEKRIYMARKFRFIFPGILAVAAVYVVWDIWFTRMGIWGFNHTYTRDFFLAGLPLEEWLFFLVVPYACIFLFEVLRYFVKRFHHPVMSRIVIMALLLLFLGMIPFVTGKIYTLAALSFTSLMLMLQLVQRTYKTWFSGFLFAYLLSLLPFIIVNGILTSLPVVWYNNAETLGIRIWTIPLEDFIYLMGLLLPAINIYQNLLHRFASPSLRQKMQLDKTSGF